MSEKDPSRMTEWINPCETIKSGFAQKAGGSVTGKEWCEKEAARINKTGTSVEVITNEQGMLAISRL